MFPKVDSSAARIRKLNRRGSRIIRQLDSHAWGVEAFGAEETNSLPQRGLRLLEEAGEAAQSTGVTLEMAKKLMDYIWSRPIGDLEQEVGGVGVTLLVLCETAGIDADEAECKEVERVLAKPIEHFKARNALKNEAGFRALRPAFQEPEPPSLEEMEKALFKKYGAMEAYYVEGNYYLRRKATGNLLTQLCENRMEAVTKAYEALQRGE